MASRGSGICIVVFDNQPKLAAAIRAATLESVKSFRQILALISFLQRTKNAVIIITTTNDNNVLQLFESLESVEVIFVFSLMNIDVNTYPSKVVGVYRQTETLLRSLPETLDTIEMQLNARSLLINRQLDRSDNPEFYFYDIWKQNTKRRKISKIPLVKQARLYFQSNNQIQYLIDDFEGTYKPKNVLVWLNTTRLAFPYHLLISHALRTHDRTILSLTRFFLKHLEQYMEPMPIGQVYFGTKLPINHVRRLEQYRKSDVVAFQCFLPVIQSRLNAFIQATKPSRRENLASVLFKIESNGALCLPLGDRLLLDMATPFHIQYITRTMGANVNQEELVIIKLITLTANERNKLLEQYFNRQETSKRKPLTTPRIITSQVKTDEDLADEHIARQQWQEAATILSRIPSPNVRVLNKHGWLLLEYLNDVNSALDCHEQALTRSIDQEKAESQFYLAKVYEKLQRYDEALKMYSQAFQWFDNQDKQDWVLIARCLVGMSTTQRALQRFDQALDCAERALAIREHRITPQDEFDIAACLENLGNILHDRGDLDRALEHALRAVELLSSCGHGDPRLAAALNNLGALYQSAGENDKAREYFQRALECLPR